METWLVPPSGEAPLWHLRVHRMKTDRSLQTAEAGFAIYGQRKDGRALDPAQGEEFGYLEGKEESRAASKAGVAGVVDLASSGREGKAIRTDANSNLYVPRAIMPTLLQEYQASDKSFWLVTGVFAIPSVGDEEGARSGWTKEWEKRPEVPEEIKKLMV